MQRKKLSAEEEKKERNRNLIIQETYKTEESFVKDMGFLFDSLGKLLEVKSLSPEDRVILRIFQNATRGIIDHPVLPTFLRQAKAEADRADSVTLIANLANDINQPINSYENFLTISVIYEMIQRLIKKLDKNTQAKATLMDILNDPKNSHLDLESYTIKPIQRMTKIPLLIKELMKNTPTEKGERAILDKALSTFEREVNKINKEKQQDKPERHIMAELLIKQANQDAKELIESLREMQPSNAMSGLQKLQKLYTDPKIGIVDKLSQMNRMINTTNILVDQQTRLEFGKKYADFKKTFSKQPLDVKSLKQMCKTFESEIAKIDESDLKTKVQKYGDFIKQLNSEQALRTQAVKRNNEENEPFQKLMNMKLEEYRMASPPLPKRAPPPIPPRPPKTSVAVANKAEQLKKRLPPIPATTAAPKANQPPQRPSRPLPTPPPKPSATTAAPKANQPPQRPPRPLPTPPNHAHHEIHHEKMFDHPQQRPRQDGGVNTNQTIKPTPEQFKKK